MIRIAPDILKLDRTLVHGAHADGSRQALLEALIGFASSTGAAICAEGVEDLEDLRVLVSLDVTYAQGYGLCRPGPAWPVPDADATARGRRGDPRRPARLAQRPRRRGRVRQRPRRALRRARRGHDRADLGAANVRAAELLGADEVALMRVAGDELELLSDRPRQRAGDRWALDDFPATRYVLEHRMPGQVVAGDEAGDHAELAELAALGFGTVLHPARHLRRRAARRCSRSTASAPRPSPPARSTAPASSPSSSAPRSTASPKGTDPLGSTTLRADLGAGRSPT